MHRQAESCFGRFDGAKDRKGAEGVCEGRKSKPLLTHSLGASTRHSPSQSVAVYINIPPVRLTAAAPSEATTQLANC